ncbi:MAG: BlaI/MecI/CopY family transcriptional regulator [Thermoguttaceae bacterium]
MSAQTEKPLKSSSFTPGELELLQILWENGPSTILEAQKKFERPIEYPTVQTRLNRLVDKGLAKKSRTRPSKYSAAIAAEDASAGHVKLLLKRVTGGSVVPLISQLLDQHNLSADELESLKKIIRQKEHENG